ncbi:MAG: hypothetical protein HYV47_02680, partial [Candidatus Nealsonbacteria bacterium]|nr:hypothetical protein [Candidatus Nealsonbacteria bacterium]
MENQRKEIKYFSLQEATKFCSYSQEYLSLRVRQGKLRGLKLGRNWVTTEEWLKEYLSHNGNGNAMARFAKSPQICGDFANQSRINNIAPPENLPVGEPFFLRQVSFGNLRPAFVAALAFVLLIGTVVFGKENLRNIYKEISPIAQSILSSQFEPIVEDIIEGSRTSLKIVKEVRLPVPEIRFPKINSWGLDFHRLSKLGKVKIPAVRLPEISLGKSIFPDIRKSNTLKRIGSKQIFVGNVSLPLGDVAQSVFQTFGNYAQWLGSGIKNNSISVFYSKADILLREKLAGDFGRFSEVISETSQFLEKQLTENARALQTNYFAFGKLVGQKSQQLSEGISKGIEGIFQASKFLKEILARDIGGISERISDGLGIVSEKYFVLNDLIEKRLVSSSQDLKENYFAVKNKISETTSGGIRSFGDGFKRISDLAKKIRRLADPKKEFFAGKGEFDELKTRMEKLEKEPFVVKRVEVEKRVEPVTEVTQKITQQITQIDNTALRQLRDDIAYLQKDVQNRLYAPGGVISQTIYVKEPIQSPKIYQENGEIVLQTSGSGNVILSAATGLQLYGKQVVIESTSLLNPQVYIADPLRVDGAFISTGAANIGGGVSAQTITLTAPSTYSGNLVNVSHGDTRRFTITESGAATLVGSFTVTGNFAVTGDQTFTGAVSISTSSASAALTVAQSGTGKIFNFSSTGSGVTADLGTITGTTQGAVLAIAQYGTGLVLDATGAIRLSEAALSAAGKVMDDLLFAVNFNRKSLVGTRGQLPTYTDTDNIPTFETIDDAAQTAPAGNAVKFTYSGETLYYPTSGNIGQATGTISFWYSPDYGYSTSVDKYLFAANNHLRIFYDASEAKFVAQAYDGAGWTTSTATSSAQTFSVDDWIHVAVTYAASSSTAPLTLYINGVMATDTDIWAAQALPTNFYIGSDSAGANQAHGLIADFNIFDRALSQQEIKQIYYLKRNLQDYAQFVSGKSLIYEKTPETALTIFQYGIGSILTASSSVDITSSAVRFTNLGTGNTLLIEDSDTDATPFYISAMGSVGIGTLSASTTLHVVSTTDQLRIGYDTGNYINFSVASDGALDLLATGTDADIELRSKNFDNALFIDDSTGRLGIGTSTPRYTVDIWGDLAVGTSTDTNTPALFVDSGNGGRIGIGTTTLAGLLTVGTSTPYLVIDPLGKTGIGATTTPSEQLAVQGNIIGSG